MTRRTFLSICAAGCARGVRAPTPGDEHWALLSDTHIDADPTKKAWDSCMAANLSKTLDEIADSTPQHILFNGDVAFRAGDPSDYAQFLSLLNRGRPPRSPVHFTLGNHDHRGHFVAALSPSHDRALESKIASSFLSQNTHFLLLDSLEKVNAITGSLGASQLAWASAQLKLRPDMPAVIFLHHNPEVSLSGLTDTPEFLALVRKHRQVKVVFFGHTHEFRLASDQGLHLVNLPALGYRFKPDEPLGWVESHFRTGGASLELHCVDGNRSKCGSRHDLTWRSNRAI